ncbi:MAG: flagellar hook-basal body complex protein FliE [Candidatus Thorarchaeota archaeon]|nr:MAG: flagellar hook-basal body complex protein FliE [Candidatus Thorarchaeota archaeon]
MKLLVLTGMPGSGKSSVADVFRRAEVPVVIMGDVIRAEVEARGLEPNPANTKDVMLELRERDGLGAVAKRCIESLKASDSDFLIIEGCRSLAEVDVFDDYAETLWKVCIHSSPKTRFSRLKNRGREDDPKDWDVFRERDLREISVGLGAVIALSDIVIINEATLEHLEKEAEGLVQRFV